MSCHLPRKRRKESFLGIHFDFHAGDECTEIGKGVTREMVEEILDLVKPDYVQTDCKGHPGLSSYPTKVGHPAPGFAKDTLRIWRDVTAERGVGLYMHYSGVWDSRAMQEHPEWARVDEEGKADPKNASVFGPYVDLLLIPQLKELRDVYSVDGVWIDGECWATCQDYSPAVISTFEAETGVKLPQIPKALGDPLFFEYTQFCREGFRKYLRHYVDELHRHDPDFQIASNWAFSSFMPEPVTADVDFISGDYSLLDSLNSARLEGRCMGRQGKPWDLMAWAFSSRWTDECRSTKSIPQLQQEAAIVLALGGGFQAYFTQKRDGSVRLWQMNLMAKVAEFCRARQDVCHKAEAVPQIALLLSSADYYRKNPRVFSPWSGEYEALKGILQALLESQYSVEVLSEHNLSGRMAQYPIVVIPEWGYLDESFRKELLDYASSGGSILTIGAHTAGLFEKELGITLGPVSEKPVNRWLEADGWLGGVSSPVRSVTLQDDVVVAGRAYHDNDLESDSEVAASWRGYGKGRIGAIYYDLGKRYATSATDTCRRFIEQVIRQIFPKPMVEVLGSKYVDVCLTRKGDRLMVNLVNTAGPHGDDKNYVFDDIPPVGPLDVSVRLPGRPRKVVCFPSGNQVSYEWAPDEGANVDGGGCLRFTVDRLEIHDVYAIDC